MEPTCSPFCVFLGVCLLLRRLEVHGVLGRHRVHLGHLVVLGDPLVLEGPQPPGLVGVSALVGTATPTEVAEAGVVVGLRWRVLLVGRGVLVTGVMELVAVRRETRGRVGLRDVRLDGLDGRELGVLATTTPGVLRHLGGVGLVAQDVDRDLPLPRGVELGHTVRLDGREGQKGVPTTVDGDKVTDTVGLDDPPGVLTRRELGRGPVEERVDGRLGDDVVVHRQDARGAEEEEDAHGVDVLVLQTGPVRRPRRDARVRPGAPGQEDAPDVRVDVPVDLGPQRERGHVNVPAHHVDRLPEVVVELLGTLVLRGRGGATGARGRAGAVDDDPVRVPEAPGHKVEVRVHRHIRKLAEDGHGGTHPLLHLEELGVDGLARLVQAPEAPDVHGRDELRVDAVRDLEVLLDGGDEGVHARLLVCVRLDDVGVLGDEVVEDRVGELGR